jgi:hypothetical protein
MVKQSADQGRAKTWWARCLIGVVAFASGLGQLGAE